jgi:hypothetical protein
LENPFPFTLEKEPMTMPILTTPEQFEDDKPRQDIVCNVDDMTTVNGSWVVSFYNSETEDSDGYDSRDFDHRTDAVEHAEMVKESCTHDDITIIIDGNG